MHQLEDFLKSLSDTELAVFTGYRFEDFLERSQQTIIAEIQSRKLTKEKLRELFTKGLEARDKNSGSCCPRCHSMRFITEEDHDLRNGRYSSYEVIVETKRCQLCGYNPDKRKPKNFIDAIMMKIRNKKTLRPAIPSERVFKEL